MISSDPGQRARRTFPRASFSRRLAAFLPLALCCCLSAGLRISAAPVDVTGSAESAGPHFTVETYDVEGGPKLSMDVVFPILSKYTGTNVSLQEIAEAAAALQAECRKEGHTNTSVAIASDRITNGVVTMNLFQTATPQVMISGVRYFIATNGMELPAYSPPPPPEIIPHPSPELAVPNAPPPPPYHRPKPATPEQIEAARKRLYEEIPKIEAEEKDHRIHVVSTNAGQRFEVEHYRILGNSVLSPKTISATLTNIDGAFGTNVSLEGVQTVVEQLQEAYHDRGYETVLVTLPGQQIENHTVKIQVLEGRLTAINVVGNNFFSSNNVMRSLPSLRTNIVIDAPVLRAELGRANANQDRQIIPIVGPGPTPGTSVLTLRVKDRLPLHAKVDLDNLSSPGTPDLRVNASAVYDNLWQLEHSIGFQYGFSPEEYKQAGQWSFYDEPVVAEYSAFYRLPLFNPQSLEQRITASPGSFGFSEATRRFNMPPVTGVPELTIFASRSTIDTGTADTFNQSITSPGQNPEINRLDVEHSPTLNEDIAARLDYPLASSGNLQSAFSGGLDFKTFQLSNYKTNVFTFVTVLQNTGGFSTNQTQVTSLVPTTLNWVEYLPLSTHYNGTWSDSLGVSTIGMGLSVNLWYDSLFATTSYDTNGVGHTTSVRGLQGFRDITGSPLSTGYWVVLNPSYTRTIMFDNWTTLFRVDGQWASEPLLSPEQFGAGGVNSVRGYPEGDVFGDNGWHVSLEEQTPPHTVGIVYGNTPLTLRGSIYVDHAVVYLIDPQGRPPSQSLWGTGVGFTATAGPHWQAQFLFSFPLTSTFDTPAFQPLFNFSLTAQF